MQTRSNNAIYFTETGQWDESHYHEVNKVLYSGKTEFQEMMILETKGYGKMLVLDGRIQSAEDDEYIYHESLVHPGLIAHPKPRAVLIIGGGEGATLREVLAHPTVERAVMVDIDREVVEQCMNLLPEWHEGAFSDPRARVIYADGKKFVETTNEKFDCVIIDICDALEDGPALALYTDSFYQSVRKCLTPGGLLIVQAMELSGEEYQDHLSVRERLSRVFRHVSSYIMFVPSFWSTWGFVIASDAIDASAVNSQEIDERIRLRNLESKLEHYDGETHAHMFALPKEVRSVLAPAASLKRDVA
ncbi:MAG: polyamine aminopropyltransferase [Gammaproteobacteria bacterium]|nr:polyamine aminopropyltransferase [Gammaproteobacteria bacterium]